MDLGTLRQQSQAQNNSLLYYVFFFFSRIQEKENVIGVLRTLTWDTVTGIIWRVNIFILICCKKDFQKQLFDFLPKQLLDEIPLSSTIRSFNLWNIYLAFWYLDPESLDIHKTSQSGPIICHTLSVGCRPLYPHHKSSLHHKLSN